MLNINKSVSYNGQSVIGDKIVAHLNANVSENGSVNISKSIQDAELYSQNKAEVLADMNEFESTVLGGIE